MKINQAMIFAAGYGKRMLPLTEHLPKPMVELCGRKLIDYVIEQLIAANMQKIVVNTYYHTELLEEHLTKYSNKIEIIIIREKELLDTGGGVLNALPYFEDQSFFALNSDTIWLNNTQNSIFSMLEKNWQEETMDMLLTLVPKENILGYSGKGDFNLNSDNTLQRGNLDAFDYVFPGVQVFSSKFLKKQEFKICSRNVFYKNAEQNNGKLLKTYGVIDKYHQWLHIGDIKSLQNAEEFIKGNKII